MQKIALITGATAGFGKATALILSRNGYDLILTGRRKEKLAEVSSHIRKETGAKVLDLSFDVRKQAEVDQQIQALRDGWENIEVLINNAGLAAGLSPIHEGLVQDWEKMIDTNVKGLLYMSRAVIPHMIRQGKGHIINISSIAGKEVYENGNVYCATKHAVEALTKGLRIELVKHNIKVSSVSPGAAETEFSLVRFKGDENRAKNVYKGYDPLTAEDIAETILFILTRPAHVNINDILIMATAQASATVFSKKTE